MLQFDYGDSVREGGGGFCPICKIYWGGFCPSQQKRVGGILFGGGILSYTQKILSGGGILSYTQKIQKFDEVTKLNEIILLLQVQVIKILN